MRQRQMWKHKWELADGGKWQRFGGRGRLRFVRQIGRAGGPLSVLNVEGAQELHLTVNAQHLGHFCLELRVAVFQAIAHLVRLDFTCGEYLAQRALCEFGQASMPPPWDPARARGVPAVAWSTVHVDSPIPWVSGRPATPARPWDQRSRSALGPDAASLPGLRTARRQRRARRSAGRSADAHPAPGQPRRTTDRRGTPAASARAQPGSPARFASALSMPASKPPQGGRCQFDRPSPRRHDLCLHRIGIGVMGQGGSPHRDRGTK